MKDDGGNWLKAVSWYLTWRYSPADVTRNAGECVVSTRNRLNFSGWWILNELTQNSKALLGTPLQSPSRLSQKHSLGRCHASRPCDLWHDKQKAAKVRTHMEGTKLNNQRNHVKSSNPQGTVLNSCREFNIPVFVAGQGDENTQVSPWIPPPGFLTEAAREGERDQDLFVGCGRGPLPAAEPRGEGMEPGPELCRPILKRAWPQRIRKRKRF